MFENIPKHWKKKKIKELCDFQNGYAFNSNDYVNDGFPIIRMSNISVNGELNLNTNNTKFFPKENIDKVKQYFLKENDVIIAMTDMSKEMGIIGKTAIIDKSDIYLLNQRVGKFIIKDNFSIRQKLLRHSVSLRFIHSAWEGYLTQEANSFARNAKERNQEVHTLHTSGHADFDSLYRLVQQIRPKLLIPIHTNCAESYQALFKVPVRILQDGERFFI